MSRFVERREVLSIPCSMSACLGRSCKIDNTLRLSFVFLKVKFGHDSFTLGSSPSVSGSSKLVGTNTVILRVLGTWRLSILDTLRDSLVVSSDILFTAGWGFGAIDGRTGS